MATCDGCEGGLEPAEFVGGSGFGGGLVGTTTVLAATELVAVGGCRRVEMAPGGGLDCGWVWLPKEIQTANWPP